MNKETPTDILNVILSLLGNFDLASLAMTSHFWDQYTRHVIPIDPSLDLYDVHFGHYRRFQGPCPCHICDTLDVDLENYEYDIRIIKHLHERYKPNWEDYVHPEDHEKIKDEDTFYKAILIVPPKIKISRAFAEWFKTAGDSGIKGNYKYRAIIKRITFPNNSDGYFAIFFPAAGSLLVMDRYCLYCCDANSPYYNHIYTGGGFTAEFSYRHFE
ncbi:hypothetical protein BNJ_00031 [Kaumoebavirus]|uniref:hypothetical protein n=1 Tax=Kaumoebavirus TaxID=1859492 RepID=UPI0009C30C2D|nr:hypothetical protein BNJ_00031 [Kaumoebavirus]ARA71874.1 hypothetical protein BNJ_00031 [Kaumoebavirus]